MTWLTNTGVSSGRLYWENTLAFFDVKGVTVPTAVSVFPRELYQAPAELDGEAYPNLIYFNEVDRGNHFAAWQEPELFTSEVRAAFRSLRETHDLITLTSGGALMIDERNTSADAARTSTESAPPTRPGLLRSLVHRLAGEATYFRSRATSRRSTARPAGSTPSR